MKPIRINIKGFNSFLDEQSIDFQELGKMGIFGIFGPTGSGKSSILDALTFALYGKTARDNAREQYININTDTARIIFEFAIDTGSQKIYKAIREIKKDKDGKANTKQIKLIRTFPKEEVIAEKEGEFKAAINNIIGLEYQDFIKTVVLPQGGFNDFLKMEGRDRRVILERLFNLEEYGDALEKKIKLRLDYYEGENAKLMGGLALYKAYTKEAFAELDKELNKCIKELEAIKLKKENSELKLNINRNIYEKQLRIKELKSELEDRYRLEEAINSCRKKLELNSISERILPFITDYENSINKKNETQAELEAIEQSYAEALQKRAAAKDSYNKYENEFKARGVLLSERRIRLEALISDWEEYTEKTGKFSEYKKISDKSTSDYDTCLKENEKKAFEIIELKTKILNLKATLKSNTVDIGFRSKLIKACELYNNLIQLEKNFKILNDADNLDREKIKKIESETAIKKEKLGLVKDKIEKLETGLELKFANEKLDELSSEREICIRNAGIFNISKNLKSGDLCPICGNVIQHLADETACEDFNNKINELESEIKNTEKNIKKLLQAKTEIEGKLNEEKNKLLTELAADAARLEAYKNNIEKNIPAKQSLLENINNIKNDINIRYNDCGSNPGIELERLSSLEKDNKATSFEIETHEKRLEELSTAKNISQSRLNKLDLEKKEYEIKLSEYKKALELLKKKLSDINGELKNPADELKAVIKEASELEANLKESRQAFDRFNDEALEIEKNMSALEKNFKYIKDVSDTRKAEILNKFKQYSKEDKISNADIDGIISEINRNRLEDGIKPELEERVKKYDAEVQQLCIALKELQNNLGENCLTEEEYNYTEQENKRINEDYLQINEKAIALKERHADFIKRLKESEELNKKSEVTAKKIALVKELKTSVGARKFVEFMALKQLDYIAASASERLFEISSGAYGLETAEDGSFKIRDYKNGGKLRNVKTLSGGETFVVSLSLALALSAHIQLKSSAPLELFFLDEGFGTLDEDLLEVVMDSLEKVHNEKLKVGLISHVEYLKQRIPVRLIVKPALSGEGGSKVSIEYS